MKTSSSRVLGWNFLLRNLSKEMNWGDEKAVTSSGEDALLIEAFQRGDKKAFDELVIRHKDRIFNLCYRFLGDYEEANDSAQEAFVKAYGSLNTFRLESAFSTWLYRIAVNACKNKLGSAAYRAKRKTVSLDNPATTRMALCPWRFRTALLPLSPEWRRKRKWHSFKGPWTPCRQSSRWW